MPLLFLSGKTLCSTELKPLGSWTILTPTIVLPAKSASKTYCDGSIFSLLNMSTTTNCGADK